MSNELKNNEWMFLIIGIIIGVIFMFFRNRDENDEEFPNPVETTIDIEINGITATYIIEDLNNYILYDSHSLGVQEKEEVNDEVKIRALKGLLQMITNQATRELPDDIRGCITDKLDDLMKNHNTGKITLDL
jgi:hypothetical protein